MDFAILENQWVKIKENEKRDKYLDIAWELIEHENDDNTN